MQEQAAAYAPLQSIGKGADIMKVMHYLAGGNTARGFYSCFDHIMPEDRRRRMYYIKGGPGVGKSSLMKEIGKVGEETGWEVEYFHCSSDPDSLDGIAFPQRGIALMDGTAPHVYDPILPGARDTLVSLGDYLDTEKLRPGARELRDIQKEISGKFKRCYHYLTAASEILQAAPQGMENLEKSRNLANDWGRRLPLRGGMGQRRECFAKAFSPKGLHTVTIFPETTQQYLLECPFGCHAESLMGRLDSLMADRGLDRIALLNPLDPSKTDMLWLPEYALLFGCVEEKTAREALPAEAAFDVKGQEEYSFDRNAYELLCQRALEQLAQAKALHDELERPYIRSMDFGQLAIKKKALFSEIGLEERE